MPFYESVFIARPDASAAQVEALTEQFSEIITANGGAVAKKEYWGLRNLAYRIKKNRKGHYTLFSLEAPPAAVAEMERNMRISEDIIRFLTVRVEQLDPNPSPMLQGRDRRDDRDRERGDRGRRHDGPREPREPREPRPASSGPASSSPASSSPAPSSSE